jgi:hypothetical protein
MMFSCIVPFVITCVIVFHFITILLSDSVSFVIGNSARFVHSVSCLMLCARSFAIISCTFSLFFAFSKHRTFYFVRRPAVEAHRKVSVCVQHFCSLLFLRICNNQSYFGVFVVRYRCISCQARPAVGHDAPVKYGKYRKVCLRGVFCNICIFLCRFFNYY